MSKTERCRRAIVSRTIDVALPCAAAASLLLLATPPAHAAAKDRGAFAMKPRIDRVKVGCSDSGARKGLVRVDADVRYSDVLDEDRYRDHYLAIRSKLKLRESDRTSLASVRARGKLRTGAKGRVIAHRFHAYLTRDQSRKVLRYSRSGAGCAAAERRSARRLSVKTRIAQRIKRVRDTKAAPSPRAASGTTGTAIDVGALAVRGIDPPLFRPRVETASGGEVAFGLATGSFTKLPIPDLVVPTDADTLAVLLGTGTGGFAPAPGSPVTTGDQFGPHSPAVADLNADGRDDVANPNGVDNVAVLLGAGGGAFTPAQNSPFGLGQRPTSIAIGDLNGDQADDIASANLDSDDASVLLGNGSGGFSAAPGSPFGAGEYSEPTSIAIGRFTAFAKNDLAVTDSENDDVTVLFGTGGGGFAPGPGSPVAAGDGPSSVAVGDLNGDGHDDLAVANLASADVSVALGTGTGDFAPAPGSPFGVGSGTTFRTGPTSVAIAELNGDQNEDLATTNTGSSDVSVLLGTGTGAFEPAAGSPFAAGAQPYGLAAGDLNGDRKDDLAVANFSGTVSVLLNNG